MTSTSSLKSYLYLVCLLPIHPSLVYAEAGGNYLDGLAELVLVVFVSWICLTVFISKQITKQDNKQTVGTWFKFLSFIGAAAISAVLVTITIMALDGLNII